MGLSALRLTQEGFDPAVLEETSEAVFDATACYFPVTFTPPPNDPHKISPNALKTGAQRACCCGSIYIFLFSLFSFFVCGQIINCARGLLASQPNGITTLNPKD